MAQAFDLTGQLATKPTPLKVRTSFADDKQMLEQDWQVVTSDFRTVTQDLDKVLERYKLKK